MSKEEISKEIDAIIEGFCLYNSLVNTGLAKRLEEITKSIENGHWWVTDLVEVEINIKGERKKISVITPNRNDPTSSMNANQHPYVMNRETNELLFYTIDGWKEMGYIVRF